VDNRVGSSFQIEAPSRPNPSPRSSGRSRLDEQAEHALPRSAGPASFVLVSALPHGARATRLPDTSRPGRARRRGLVRSSVLSVVDSDRHDGGAPHEGGALDDAGVPDGGGAVDDSVAPKRTWWWQRRTLRQIKRDEATQCSDYTDQWDARENDETRLPENEVVHLGGVTLVEAFTPSNGVQAVQHPKQLAASVGHAPRSRSRGRPRAEP
jgi:hypothetical protein